MERLTSQEIAERTKAQELVRKHFEEDKEKGGVHGGCMTDAKRAKKAFYYTGKWCDNGHQHLWNTYTRRCTGCEAAEQINLVVRLAIK